jgi:hypothetical protein
MKIYKLAKATDSNVEKIKQHLVESEDFESYEEFVDNQSMGDCQIIVADIKRNFNFVTAVFGEITIDGSYIDEYSDEQNKVTHHWIEIDGVAYDFSKGSLKNYVRFDDIYDPEITMGELDRYRPMHKK